MDIEYVVLIAVTLCSIVLNLLLMLKIKKSWSLVNNKKSQLHSVEDVSNFYDKHTVDFLKVYGDVIQAFRTTDVHDLLDYELDAMDMEDGMRVLDAGCGICAPAIYLAEQRDVEIDAISISQDQVDRAKKAVEARNLQDRVRVIKGDYHKLEDYLETDTYDLIYFLESFGHGVDHKRILDQCWAVLKPGGSIYIKDLFLKEAALSSMQNEILREAQNINEAYKYNIPDLYEILRMARKKGYILARVKTIDIPLEKFENLTISNDFQELTGINKIDNLQNYVFPVDFFELKLIKPWNALEYGNSRYFLQNLYYMQVHNKKQEEL